MKRINFLACAILSTAVFTMPSSAFGDIVTLVDLSPGNNAALQTRNGTGNALAVNPRTFDATTDLTSVGLNNIAWVGTGINAGLTGTFDLSLVATGTTTVGGAVANIFRGGAGAFGVTNSTLGAGESLTVNGLVASDFTGDLVGVSNLVFDGVYIGNFVAGGTINDNVFIDGIAGTGGVNGGSQRNATNNGYNALAASASSFVVTSTTGNGVSINGVRVSFTATTAVPEPSSMALFGLVSLFLASRRRRA